jgi:hypothetical protein
MNEEYKRGKESTMEVEGSKTKADECRKNEARKEA